MKMFKFLAVFVLAASLFSCSSDSSSDSSQQQGEYFNLTYNGTSKTVNNWNAIKQEGFIEVSADTPDGLGLSLKFNTHGNLYQSFTHPNSMSSTFPLQTSFAYYSDDTFNFDLTEINTTNKTIKVTFNGKVYDDEYDHTSAYSTVSGSFQISYIDYTPTVTGLGTYAKINNQDWYAVQSGSTGDLSTTTLNIKNGTQYEIGIVYPYFSPTTGTFNFSDNTANKRVAFSKYDTATHQNIEYNVSGTITYTEATPNYVKGTFSLTATHPTNGSTVTISNGTFKELIP